MTAKTTLLILLLACCGSAWAQNTTNDATSDDVARKEALLRALREAEAAAANPTNATLLAQATPISKSNYFSPASAAAPTPVTPTATAPTALPTIPTPPAINPAGLGSNATPRRPFRPPFAQTAAPNFPTPGAPNTAVPPGIGTAPMASGPAAQPEQTIAAGMIDFPQVPLDQVLDIYGDLIGRTILRGQLPPVQITLKTKTTLTKREAIDALNSVLAMNGITLVPFGDKFMKAVQGNGVFTTAQPFTTNSDANMLPEADSYMMQVTQLKYTKPSELVPLLAQFGQVPNGIVPIDSSGVLVIRDYAANVKRMMELIKQIDVMVPLDYDSKVIPIKYAKAADIASALASLGGNAAGSIGHGSSTGTRTGTGTTGGFGSAMGTGTLGNQNNTMGGFNNNNNQNQMGSNPRTSSFTDRLQSIVSKAANSGEFKVFGQTKIISDERTNSLLVFAGKQDMEMIEKIVHELDVVLAQVLIESIIMEVSLDSSHSLGVSYVQNPGSASHGYFSGLGGVNNGTILNSGTFSSVGTNLASSIPSGFSYWANFGNDFQATVTAIAADSRINVLSRPRIQTSHGVTANIQVGQQVPMITGTYFGGVTGVGSSSQYSQQFVGISLQVTPLINPDGLVVMDIQQQVQDLGPNYKIDGNDVPSTTQRSAQATVSVKDRDTIILGGMISSSKNTSDSGVPILKDIPGLGALFRSKSVDKKRTELIVLIRPTVLPSPESAALVATHERAKLPLVKSAEADERKTYNQQMKAAEKIQMPEEKN